MMAALALTASSALAAKTHPYTGTSFGPDGAAGSESFTAVQGVGVDQASGDVYVFDGGVGKLFKFDAGGEPADFSSLGTNAISGVRASGNGENEVAVAPAGAPGGTGGDIYIANVAGIQVFDPGAGEPGQLRDRRRRSLRRRHEPGRACLRRHLPVRSQGIHPYGQSAGRHRPTW